MWQANLHLTYSSSRVLLKLFFSLSHCVFRLIPSTICLLHLCSAGIKLKQEEPRRTRKVEENGIIRSRQWGTRWCDGCKWEMWKLCIKSAYKKIKSCSRASSLHERALIICGVRIGGRKTDDGTRMMSTRAKKRGFSKYLLSLGCASILQELT